MVAVILALVAVVSYLELANQHGTERVELLHPRVVEHDHRYDARRDEVVRRFGHTFGGRDVD